MQNALYSPFASRLNPKDVDQCGATHSFIWWARWAESGGLTRCELKWPSFGCLNSIQVWTGRWGPFHFIVLTWLTDKWNNFGWILFITKLDWLEILVVSEIQPYWSAKSFLVALLTFRLTEQGTLVKCSRDGASIPCIVIFLYLPYFLLLM